MSSSLSIPFGEPVDYAEHTASLAGFGHHYLDRIGSLAEDPAYLRDHFDRVQDVDRVITFAKEHEEACPAQSAIAFF